MTLPPVRVPHPHVVVDPSEMGGSPHVLMRDGRPLPVRRLWQWHRRGVAVETLARRYPITRAALYDALSFAHDNADLVEADIDRERALLAGQ